MPALLLEAGLPNPGPHDTPARLLATTALGFTVSSDSITDFTAGAEAVDFAGADTPVPVAVGAAAAAAAAVVDEPEPARFIEG